MRVAREREGPPRPSTAGPPNALPHSDGQWYNAPLRKNIVSYPGERATFPKIHSGESRSEISPLLNIFLVHYDLIFLIISP